LDIVPARADRPAAEVALMALVKPQSSPGFLAQATQVQAAGGWYDGNLVRWRTGLLEKMDGWRRLFDKQMGAVVRRMHAWLDLRNRKNLLIAADDGVHILVQGSLYGLGQAAYLPGALIPEVGSGASTTFSVALGSKEVTVGTGVVATVGGTFVLGLPISIGGRIILAGTFFTVKAVILDIGFTFDMPFAALVAESATYGIPLLTNDIPNGFTVTWKAHGVSPGLSVRISQTTTIRLGAVGVWEQLNFSAPAGSAITVASVIDADHFTILMGTYGTGNGAGGANHQIYLGGVVEHAPASFNSSTGTVIGLAIQTPLGNPQRQSWFLNNLGENGLALASGGPLQVYQPPIENGPFLTTAGVGPPFTVPQMSNGMLVAMPQGQVVLWGTEPVMGAGMIDPLLIRFSDVGTYDSYTATVSNQAGSFRLSRGSRIVGAIQAPQATLILTDTDLWLMNYIGPPLVYGFTIIGSGCGLAAPHAIGVLGRLTIWQGLKNFWSYDSAVQSMQCMVWDYIFKDIDPVNANKCHAAPNSVTNEMAFYFPSKSMQVNVDANLLLSSQLFSDLSHWLLINTAATRFSKFRLVYVYEQEFLLVGWSDEAGMSPASWLDHDLSSSLDNLVLAPDATDTAFLLQETAANGMHSISQEIIKSGDPITYTLSIYVHNTSTRNLTLRAVSGFGEVFVTFDVTTGNVLDAGVTTSNFALLTIRVLDNELGPVPGWRRYVMTFTSDDSDFLDIFFNLTDGAALNYQGAPPNGALIWGAQLVEGGEPLLYQPTGPVAFQNETRFYVKVNTAEGVAWDSGKLSRSAWIDESVWGTPLGADTTPIPTDGVPLPVLDEPIQPTSLRNRIQQHEIGYDDDDEPMRGVFAETGMTELGDGTMLMLIDEIHPDMKWFGRDGAVKISVRAANFPQGPAHLYGPYSMTPGTQWVTPRVRTRYAAVRYDWEPQFGYSARVGVTTLRVKPAGRMP
jgi:hypothetical protein